MVLARYARNDRLADAVHWSAFCSLNASPGARAYYDELVRHEAPVRAVRRWESKEVEGLLAGLSQQPGGS